MRYEDLRTGDITYFRNEGYKYLWVYRRENGRVLERFLPSGAKSGTYASGKMPSDLVVVPRDQEI